MNNVKISESNATFWNELCGSYVAQELGITEFNSESLKKYDDWYLKFYPYLANHIPFASLKGKHVLEVGLGFGTVSQKIAESGAIYTGLDIAPAAVEMVNLRLNLVGLPVGAVHGNILAPPFLGESFDVIVAVGSLHHTGNLKLAIDSCWNLLKPNGKLIFMVYNAYSYRRIYNSPFITFKYLIRELSGLRGVVGLSTNKERAAFDSSAEGHGPPSTDWVSIRSLGKLCNRFSSFSAKLENINQEPPFRRYTRATLLNTFIPSILGLDIYVTCEK